MAEWADAAVLPFQIQSVPGTDVNGDGLLDLVCHFDASVAGFTEWEYQGTLKGSTVSGMPLVGTDAVTIVGR